jgi:hypothetical protein
MIPDILLLPSCRTRPSTDRPLIHRDFVARGADPHTLQVVESLRIFVVFWLVVFTKLSLLPLGVYVEGEG